MSNETEEGVQEVKTAACDKLLQARVDARMAGKKVRRRFGKKLCVRCFCIAFCDYTLGSHGTLLVVWYG